MCENQIKNQFQKVSNEMTEMSGAKSEKNQKESDDLLWTMPLELTSCKKINVERRTKNEIKHR